LAVIFYFLISIKTVKLQKMKNRKIIISIIYIELIKKHNIFKKKKKKKIFNKFKILLYLKIYIISNIYIYIKL